MTFRQRIQKAFYPLIMLTSGLTGRKKILDNKEQTPPVTSIYDLKFTRISGQEVSLSEYKGKKLMIVNTASGCGYTDQLESLQKLWQHHKDGLVIIGFPSNDFRNQEKLSNDQILGFCTSVYHLNFPIAQKTVVKKTSGQHPIYQWLSDKNQNGWNDKMPSWNFSKYVIDENGVLTHYFDAGFDPTSGEVLKAVL